MLQSLRIMPFLAIFCVFLMAGCAPATDGAAENGAAENGAVEPEAVSEATSSQVAPVNPADVESIDAIIKAYYDVVSGPAGEIPDKARDVSLHHPDHWIAIANTTSGGRAVVRTMNLDGYYGELQPRAEAFYEWETDRVVHQNKNMATVWSHYATSRTPDGEPFATGVNTITLWNDGTRWWIMNWMFDNTP